MTPSVRAIAIGVLGLSACVHTPRPSVVQPPDFLVGAFEDDYGGRHTVTAADWTQGRKTVYHITRWVPEQTYLIAHNDTANSSDGGKWTRIDWVQLAGMPPYDWAFCFSAYDAASAAAAESTHVVHPDTPKTGCNGFPYSRMKRVAPLSRRSPLVRPRW